MKVGGKVRKSLRGIHNLTYILYQNIIMLYSFSIPLYILSTYTNIFVYMLVFLDFFVPFPFL